MSAYKIYNHLIKSNTVVAEKIKTERKGNKKFNKKNKR